VAPLTFNWRPLNELIIFYPRYQESRGVWKRLIILLLLLLNGGLPVVDLQGVRFKTDFTPAVKLVALTGGGGGGGSEDAGLCRGGLCA